MHKFSDPRAQGLAGAGRPYGRAAFHLGTLAESPRDDALLSDVNRSDRWFIGDSWAPWATLRKRKRGSLLIALQQSKNERVILVLGHLLVD